MLHLRQVFRHLLQKYTNIFVSAYFSTIITCLFYITKQKFQNYILHFFEYSICRSIRMKKISILVEYGAKNEIKNGCFKKNI